MIEEIIKCIDKYKTIAIESIDDNKGKFLTINSKYYTLNNGIVLERDMLVKPRNKAAMIIPMTKDGKFVIVVQPRVATSLGVTVEFPAGLVEENESIIEGSTRELTEETGYKAGKAELLAEYYQDVATTEATIGMVLARDCIKVCDQKLDEDEFVNFFEVTYEELLKLIELKLIVDGNTLFCIEKLKNII